MSTPYSHYGRSGLGRSNLMRSGLFIPNVVITINGTDRTTLVQRKSLSVTLARNAEPSSATFRLIASGGTVVVTVGHSVSIALGAASNPIFGGQVIDAEHVFENDGESTPWIQVTCTDWSALFNRRTVTYDYSGWTATNAAVHVIQNYTSGFSTSRIMAGLDTLQEFPVTNEYPGAILARMAVSIGGGFKFDGEGHPYLWGSAGLSGAYAGTNPDTLVPGLWSLQEFVHGYDFSQIRTRAICEGASSTIPVELPAGEWGSVKVRGVPFAYGVIPFNGSSHPHGNYARIGATLLVSYGSAVIVSGPPATELTADVSPGDTTVNVVDNTAFVGPGGGEGWAHANGRYFSFEAVAPGTTLINIPATGIGSIGGTDDIPAGTPVYMAHSLKSVAIQTPSGVLETAIPAGQPITVRMIENDTAAQAVIAAVEGGDGVREFFMADGDLTHEGCSWAAREQLNQFAAVLPRVTWTTRDMNALPGRQQAVNIPLTGGLVDTVTIDKVTLTFPSEADNDHALPIRQCEGSSVRLRGILDMILARGV